MRLTTESTVGPTVDLSPVNVGSFAGLFAVRSAVGDGVDTGPGCGGHRGGGQWVAVHPLAASTGLLQPTRWRKVGVRGAPV